MGSRCTAGRRAVGRPRTARRPAALAIFSTKYGRHAPAAVREYGEAARHVERRHLAGPEREREIGRHGLRAEAELRDVPRGRTDARAAQQPDRYEVARTHQPLAHRRRTVEALGDVLRPPLLGAVVAAAARQHDGRVVHERGRREPVLERGRVEEGLERRSGLSPGLRRPVVLARVEVEAADQRDDRAVARIERGKGRAHGGHLGQAVAPVLERLDVDDLADLRARRPPLSATGRRCRPAAPAVPRTSRPSRARSSTRRGARSVASRSPTDDDERGAQAAAVRMRAQRGADRRWVQRQRRGRPRRAPRGSRGAGRTRAWSATRLRPPRSAARRPPSS